MDSLVEALRRKAARRRILTKKRERTHEKLERASLWESVIPTQENIDRAAQFVSPVQPEPVPMPQPIMPQTPVSNRVEPIPQAKQNSDLQQIPYGYSQTRQVVPPVPVVVQPETTVSPIEKPDSVSVSDLGSQYAYEPVSEVGNYSYATSELVDIPVYHSNEMAQVQDSSVNMLFNSAEEMMDEDLLLGRIDEFREKARQLQDMMVSRESKARELEQLVREREYKATELEQILVKRQEAAAGVSEEMAKRFDLMMSQVTEHMDMNSNTLRQDIASLGQNQAASDQQLTDAISELSLRLESLGTSMGGFDTDFSGFNETITNLSNSLGEITSGIDSLSDDIDDISEKIHSENVKSYRNTVDLFKEMDEKMDHIDDLQADQKNVEKYAKGAMIIAVINLVATLLIYLVTTLT